MHLVTSYAHPWKILPYVTFQRFLRDHPFVFAAADSSLCPSGSVLMHPTSWMMMFLLLIRVSDDLSLISWLVCPFDMSLLLAFVSIFQLIRSSLLEIPQLLSLSCILQFYYCILVLGFEICFSCCVSCILTVRCMTHCFNLGFWFVFVVDLPLWDDSHCSRVLSNLHLWLDLYFLFPGTASHNLGDVPCTYCMYHLDFSIVGILRTFTFNASSVIPIMTSVDLPENQYKFQTPIFPAAASNYFTRHNICHQIHALI